MGSLKLQKPYIYVYLPGFILLLAAILLHFVDVFVAVSNQLIRIHQVLQT